MHYRVVPALIAILFAVAALALVPAVSAEAPEQTAAIPGAQTSRPAVRTEHPTRLNVALAETAGVDPDVLALALDAVTCAVKSGDIAPPATLTLIDYSLPSTEPRLWVFDLRTGTLKFHELVAHGQGTGGNMAEHFSDAMNSHQSSLGLFVTRDTYVGSNGYSLRLDGLEPGFNGRARERAIVMHGAPYVDAVTAAKQGRLGRSWGCPALRQAVAREVIDFVRDGGVVFSYYPDETWLQRSRYLNCARTAEDDIRQARADRSADPTALVAPAADLAPAR